MFLLYIGVLVLSIPMALVLFVLFGISRRRVCLLAAALAPGSAISESTCYWCCRWSSLVLGLRAVRPSDRLRTFDGPREVPSVTANR